MGLIDFSKDTFALTDVGLVRKANEDNHGSCQTPNGFLFVVCDGMGGHAGGATASRIAVDSIIDFFNRKQYPIIQQALADSLNFANSQILGTAAQNPNLAGMGTTACVVLLQGDKVWYAHVGDSRIYRFCNSQQRLYRLTKDHSVVQGLIDNGVITEAQAEHHPNKNQLVRSLGIKMELQPEVCRSPVSPANGDLFLICSDGLYGMTGDEVLQHILGQNISLQEKGANMLTIAKQAGGADNITLQLINITKSPHSTSVFDNKQKYPKKRKKKTWLLPVAAVVLLLSSALLFFTLNPQKIEKKAEPKQVAAKQAEIKQEPAWEKRRKELGYNHIATTKDGRYEVYGKTKFKQFEGILVNTDENKYYEGTINNTSDGEYTPPSGTPKEYWKSYD